MQTVFGQGGGRDIETAQNDVLDGLRQRVPASAEIPVDDLQQFLCRDVADVLIGQVGHAHDGTLLDGPGKLQVLVKLDLGHLITTLLIVLFHQQRVVLDLLNEEGALEDV